MNCYSVLITYCTCLVQKVYLQRKYTVFCKCLVQKVYLQRKYPVCTCLEPKVYLQRKYTVCARVSYQRCTCNEHLLWCTCIVPYVYLQRKYTVCARVSYQRCTSNEHLLRVHVSCTKRVLASKIYCVCTCLVVPKVYLQRKFSVGAHVSAQRSPSNEYILFYARVSYHRCTAN